MLNGVIDELNTDGRRMGFIRYGNGGRIFFHQHDLMRLPWSALRVGLPVQFQMGEFRGKSQARGVQAVKESQPC